MIEGVKIYLIISIRGSTCHTLGKPSLSATDDADDQAASLRKSLTYLKRSFNFDFQATYKFSDDAFRVIHEPGNN